jgi:DNA invertase Pin-like site-specific DNA recombinase
VAAQSHGQHGLPGFSDYATVIHYGRYSSAKQAAGTSEERQLDKADQWAAREGVVFTDRLIDRGKSGFHGKHRTEGDFGTLLQQVKDSIVPTPALLVLVEGDRAGREDVDVQLESLVLGLLRGGVDLFVVDAGLHLNLERWRVDLGAQIQLQAILHGANQYSRRLSARMQDAHARGRRGCPAGMGALLDRSSQWQVGVEQLRRHHQEDARAAPRPGLQRHSEAAHR